MAITAPKRFVFPVDGPSREDPEGNFIYWSDYEALVEAFAIYAEEGMDDAEQVFEVLEARIGAEKARFIANMVGEAMSEDPADRKDAA